MARIVILGAGLVARPLVRYLAAKKEHQLVLASLYPADLEEVTLGLSGIETLPLDARDDGALRRVLTGADLVVSLLPATEHVRVGGHCLELGCHLATASYISPEMQALDGAVQAKELVFLNECGLDPGLDHMSAMRIIDGVHGRGGKVKLFRSNCGGLPAPEANTNPIGYKFSWSPRGVLVAAGNAARYREDGQVREIDGKEIFAQPQVQEIPGAGSFEYYPNRDSLIYCDLYGLKDVETMYRGTFRNLGHCEAWYQWSRLGLLSTAPRKDLAKMTHRDFCLGLTTGDGDDPATALAAHLDIPRDHRALTNLDWLGMFSNEALESTAADNIDVLGRLMGESCCYGPDERDMIVLHHEFDLVYGERVVRATSTLVDFGIPGGESAMSRTVSLPLAIAVAKILSGEIKARGVLAPVIPEIYNPVLDELETLGIRFVEKI